MFEKIFSSPSAHRVLLRHMVVYHLYLYKSHKAYLPKHLLCVLSLKNEIKKINH